MEVRRRFILPDSGTIGAHEILIIHLRKAGILQRLPMLESRPHLVRIEMACLYQVNAAILIIRRIRELVERIRGTAPIS